MVDLRVKREVKPPNRLGEEFSFQRSQVKAKRKEICPEMHVIAKLTNLTKQLLTTDENNKSGENNK